MPTTTDPRPLPGPVRVAVVGAGVMGAHHAARLAGHVAGARVTVVAGGSGAAALAATLPGCRVEADPYAAITAEDVDAVVVAGPDDTHAGYALACLAADRPVLCEKPLADTVEAAAEVAAVDAAVAARTGRSLVQVGFMRRFDPDFRALRTTIADRELGEPLLMHCVHRNASSPPRATTDLMITGSVVHEVDTVRWLLGEEVTAVTVHRPRATRHAPAGESDPLLVLLETSGGRLVDVECFVRTGVGYEVRTELVAEDGSVLVGLPTGPVRQTPGHRGTAVPADYRTRFAAAYDLQLRAWLDAVAAGRGVAGPGARDGLAAAVVCAAGLQALATGRRVEVPALPA
ncbi:Gfo/Idh/MocA family oxidoreductase [Geodermatophilus sp. Leaf369]|uniref:Gfo/Idh/MocA family oxidoreductase n=1 Tax=Geodermatophilus sp. Leaf369 TaxID=1736354 RepID=UPI00191101FF|nr:Gfo/Idh/MocA family oxidoreductase [Geodermatophilus sp. Leaf369]